jgi:hypothetical protein
MYPSADEARRDRLQRNQSSGGCFQRQKDVEVVSFEGFNVETRGDRPSESMVLEHEGALHVVEYPNRALHLVRVTTGTALVNDGGGRTPSAPGRGARFSSRFHVGSLVSVELR